MYPYLFGWKLLPTYAVLMAVGFAAGIVLNCALTKKDVVPRRDVLFCSLFAMCGGILGAKIFSLFQNLHLVFEKKIEFIELVRGGFVFYGGLIGGALGAAAYIKLYKFSFAKMFDSLCLGVPLGHAFGRLGCFCAGCCYGVECGAFGFSYSNPADTYTPVGVKLFPVQILESLALLLLFACMLLIRRKLYLTREEVKSKEKHGEITLFYIISYSLVRFCLEFLRGDGERGFYLGLSTAQWVSIITVITALVFIIIKINAVQKKNKTG